MSEENKQKSSIWGGRFRGGPSDLMQEINASITFDKALYAEDIQGSKAHAQMLEKQHIISPDDLKAIQQGLDKIHMEIASGAFSFSVELEDIHMNIETRLAELIGDPAKRLHTARSRNDQVATDIRLYVRNQIDELDVGLQQLQKNLLKKAGENTKTLMPGYTHLQTAQPISFGFHLAAYIEMIGRDRQRLQDCRKRVNESPLGAAALAGTSFPIDRHLTAKLLDFDRPMPNALDAVSARDFALEFTSAATICAIHLSRLAEEIVIWSTDRFNFIGLSDEFTTGSSIMPQKKNPDAAELIRAKPGRIMGHFISLATILKGLPLAYGKDMQEDKEPLFDTTKTLSISIAAMSGMIADMSINKAAMRDALQKGHPTATDLADFLVRNLGKAFRDAHHISGALVALADERGCALENLSLTEMQSIEPLLDENVYSVLKIEDACNARCSFGGTAASDVELRLAEAAIRFNLNDEHE
ncbi:MAG: argininosuccinate lyase [Alphaproteobacteria bacterium]|nr:argininosuccinate lyase [Alphaproteobacteria bacterium]